MVFSAPIFMKLEFTSRPKEEIFYPELIKNNLSP
jgi:hypothetical protein